MYHLGKHTQSFHCLAHHWRVAKVVVLDTAYVLAGFAAQVWPRIKHECCAVKHGQADGLARLSSPHDHGVRRFSDSTHARQVSIGAGPVQLQVTFKVEPSERSLGECCSSSAKSDFQNHLVEQQVLPHWQQRRSPKQCEARRVCTTTPVALSHSCKTATALQSGGAHLGCKPKVLGQDGLVHTSPTTAQFVWCCAPGSVFTVLL
jgi:hypothetical protein